MNWQPIETGPRDGTRVLLFGPGGIDIGEWQDEVPEQRESGVVVDPGCSAGWWGNISYWPDDNQPTYWQPLPEIPSVFDAVREVVDEH